MRPADATPDEKGPTKPWRPLSDDHRAKISAARKRQTRPQRIGGGVASWVLDEEFDELEG